MSETELFNIVMYAIDVAGLKDFRPVRLSHVPRAAIAARVTATVIQYRANKGIVGPIYKKSGEKKSVPKDFVYRVLCSIAEAERSIGRQLYTDLAGYFEIAETIYQNFPHWEIIAVEGSKSAVEN